jgi:hypothetical protein
VISIEHPPVECTVELAALYHDLVMNRPETGMLPVSRGFFGFTHPNEFQLNGDALPEGNTG